VAATTSFSPAWAKPAKDRAAAKAVNSKVFFMGGLDFIRVPASWLARDDTDSGIDAEIPFNQVLITIL
jgi:hypothetical protein